MTDSKIPRNASDSSSVSYKAPVLENTLGVILAAGLGKRMRTSLPKVAHSLLGKPLVLWAVDAMRAAGVGDITVVLSPAQQGVANLIREHFGCQGAGVGIAWQDEAKGTGHAALCGLRGALAATPSLASRLGSVDVIVGFGDTPAVLGGTFARYLEDHRAAQNDATIFAFEPLDPTGYGRVLTGPDGAFEAIREDKDCSPGQRAVRLSNSGFLCARGIALDAHLPRLGNTNAAGEYYLTDVPRLVREAGGRVGVFKSTDERELAGVNSQEQLAAMAVYLQARVLSGWMARGVQFLDPRASYIEPTVTFGRDVVVEPFCYLAGTTHVPDGTRVKAGTRLAGGV